MKSYLEKLNYRRWFVQLGLLIVLLPSANASELPIKTADKSIKDNAIKTGASLYRQHCVICHGPTGKGDGRLGRSLKAPDLLLRLNDKSANWMQSILQGKGAMPAWKAVLTEQQINDIVIYLKGMHDGGRE